MYMYLAKPKETFQNMGGGGGGAKRSKCVAQAHSELGGSGGSYSRRFYRVSLLRYMPCVSLSVG